MQKGKCSRNPGSSSGLRANYHTHTSYCDGKNTVEEMVLQAISDGMECLGFSGHSYTAFDKSYCMSLQNTARYVNDIAAAKEKYADKLTVLCGLEVDYYANLEDSLEAAITLGDAVGSSAATNDSIAATGIFDYTIGSVHYVEKNGAFYDVDASEAYLLDAVKKAWNGDIYSFVEDYYALAGDVLNKTNADIIGHLDLVTKFNEGDKLFSCKHPRYVAALTNAIRSLIPSGKPFEINTGAMQRGYRLSPYPSAEALALIHEFGGSIIISSDAHSKDALMYDFDGAISLAKKIGFSEVLVLNKGFKKTKKYDTISIG